MVNKIGLLFFLIPFLSFSQIKPKIVYTDLQRMNLKGNVKEVFESDLKIENNQITESGEVGYAHFPFQPTQYSFG